MTFYEFIVPAVAIAFGIVMALVARQIAKNDKSAEGVKHPLPQTQVIVTQIQGGEMLRQFDIKSLNKPAQKPRERLN